MSHVGLWQLKYHQSELSNAELETYLEVHSTHLICLFSKVSLLATEGVSLILCSRVYGLDLNTLGNYGLQTMS